MMEFDAIGALAWSDFENRSPPRPDGKRCDAKIGECRFRFEYYNSSGINWKDEPCANEKCPDRCPFLEDAPEQAALPPDPNPEEDD